MKFSRTRRLLLPLIRTNYSIYINVEKPSYQNRMHSDRYFLSVCHDFDTSHQNFFIGIATFTHEVSPDLEYMSSPFRFKEFKIVFPFVNFEMSKFSRLSVELSYRSASLLYTLLNFQFQSQFSIFIHNICWTYQDKTLFTMWYSFISIVFRSLCNLFI